jgi:DNA repair protein RadC
MSPLQEQPEQDRPRERLSRLGASALTDAELLAILLRVGRRGVTAVELGAEMLKHFGTLENLCRATVPELAKIKGVGPTKAVQLKAAFEIAARMQKSEAQSRPANTPQAVWELLGEEMRLLDHESVRVILLNTKMKVLSVEEISRGSLNEALVTPRDVFRPALARQAYGVVLVHNHPSGDPTPSASDRNLTRQLVQASEVMGIRLIDHVILGAPREGVLKPWMSFREAGLL